MKKEITFIYTDKAEYQNYYPIYEEAVRRGYKAKFTTNILEKCEIGMYCQHDNFPQFSRFSVIMLHDIIQGYGRWPDIWYQEPWDKYDVGILPGKEWSDMWKDASKYSYANPKYGVYEIGWPKADIVGNIDKEKNRQKLCEEYGLDPNKKTVLYAPAWENDNKQDDFVKALLGLEVNILIKQAPMSKEKYPEIVADMEKMHEMHKDIPGVFILDPAVNILHAISISDVLVSEESSTMCEAVLMGIPSVSVSDWLIPDCTPKRFPKNDYPFVIRTTKGELRECIKEILQNYKVHKEYAENYSKENYKNIGQTAKIIMDIVDSYVDGNPTSKYKIEPASEKVRLPFNKKFHLVKQRVKLELAINLSVRYKAIGTLKSIYNKMRKK